MKEQLGIRIRELRIERRLTQAEFAKKIGYKHPSIISEIESGKKGISAEKLPQIANVLGVEVNSLFFEEKLRKTRTNTFSA